MLPEWENAHPSNAQRASNKNFSMDLDMEMGMVFNIEPTERTSDKLEAVKLAAQRSILLSLLFITSWNNFSVTRDTHGLTFMARILKSFSTSVHGSYRIWPLSSVVVLRISTFSLFRVHSRRWVVAAHHRIPRSICWDFLPTIPGMPQL